MTANLAVNDFWGLGASVAYAGEMKIGDILSHSFPSAVSGSRLACLSPGPRYLWNWLYPSQVYGSAAGGSIGSISLVNCPH
jgi:hypothetical protein